MVQNDKSCEIMLKMIKNMLLDVYKKFGDLKYGKNTIFGDENVTFVQIRVLGQKL